jgi:hypothetical protein
MMAISNTPALADIHSLFSNHDPHETWGKAADIIGSINPAYDFSILRTAFDDVMRLFHGTYPGYCAIQTLYHDLPHTLDVFLCAARLTHGVHVSGTVLADHEITLVLISALMHDIGYAQRIEEETGTGAQFTQEHVNRGVKFMQRYLTAQNLPHAWAAPLELMMRSTEHMKDFSKNIFPDERVRLFAQMVGTADLVGQMADRTYLEKLLYLYLEFKEAQLGNYQSLYDMLRRSRNFYEVTRQQRLDADFGSLYTKFASHFKNTMGVENNYYLESMERNMAYLSQAAQLDEVACLAMLKRGGIVEKSRILTTPDNPA